MSQGAVLFFSTYFTRIDGKGRVSFPAAFRTAITAKNSRGVVIYSSLVDPAIEGVSVERMERMSAALEGEYEQFDRQRAMLETVIFGGSQELLIDKEGRCSLPKHFLDKAGIDSDLAFVGKGSTFQIWDPKQLEKRMTEATDALKAGAVPFPKLQAPTLHGTER